MKPPLTAMDPEGVTAGVVGLIAITTLTLARAAISNWLAALIFVGALSVVYGWKSKFAIPAIIVASGCAGWLLL